MKSKIRPLLVLLSFSFALFSCSKNARDIESPVKENIAYTPDPSLYRQLLEIGFKADEIVESKDYYCAQGDILFRKFLTDTVRLKQYFGNSDDQLGRRSIDSTFTGAQIMQGNIIFSQKVENIRVFVDASLGSAWGDVMPQALKMWAGVPDCKVNFTQVEYSPAYATGNDIVVSKDVNNEVAWDAIAKAEFPRFGGAGPTILISANYVSTLSYNLKLWTLAHELGHCMGLKHTDQGISNGGFIIPNTPLTDPASIMNHSFDTQGSVIALSANDKVAIKYLYPYLPLDKWITYPEGKYGSDPIYPNSGYSINTTAINIQWNKNLVNTPTVRLELYKNDVLKQVIATAAPNTGSYFAEVGPYLDMVGTEYAFFVQIKIISNQDPSYSDMTSKFLVYVP